jgi:hypothetical protein
VQFLGKTAIRCEITKTFTKAMAGPSAAPRTKPRGELLDALSPHEIQPYLAKQALHALLILSKLRNGIPKLCRDLAAGSPVPRPKRCPRCEMIVRLSQLKEEAQQRYSRND